MLRPIQPSPPRSGSRPVAVFAALALFMGMGCAPEAKRPPMLTDLSGQPVEPFLAAQPTVFVFLRTDCPISNGYAPEIRRLRKTYTARGIGFRLVFPVIDETADEIRRQLADYGLDGPAFRDPDLGVVHLGQARVTPSVAVFDAARTLVYHGRIDDRFPALGVKRAEPTRRELVEVLDALTAGRPVTTPSAPAIGCSLPLVP